MIGRFPHFDRDAAFDEQMRRVYGTDNIGKYKLGAVDLQSNFGYLYDTFHANIEERDPAGVIGEVIGAINYIHISENDRGTPGRGHIDFRAAIQAAKRAGYDGWFTIEAFGHAMPDLAAATRIWRVMYDSESEVIEAGARVIRDGWKD